MASRREFIRWLGATGIGAATANDDLGLMPPAWKRMPMLPTGSDIGSLYPFVQGQTLRGEFPLSFLRNEFKNAASWRTRARARFMELLHYAPPRCDPNPEVVEKVDRGDYVREKVYFNTTPDIRVPAFVLIPKGLKKPAPAIVALHDHGGFYLWAKEKLVETDDEHPVLTEFKKRFYAGRSTASDLARQGYAVIVIDKFFWGERRMLLDDDPADWRERPKSMPAQRVREFNLRANRSEDLMARSLLTTGITWPGIIFLDDMRTVDYLVSRPEVDKNRIGCVGLSVGGFRACHLTALDERIKAGVVVGWMASFPTQIKTQVRDTIGFTMLVPGLYRFMDYPDVAAMSVPRPLLVINGAKDWLFDLDGVHHCFEKLNACYTKAGAPDKIKTHLYDTPHEFNAEMQAEAWEWLRRWV
jgi:dienelactone hydrolase